MSSRRREDEEERHIVNTMHDYDAFISQLNQYDHDHTSVNTFEASSELKKLQQQTRVWIHENIELIQKAFPPGSQFAPLSVKGRSKRDYSIYVGCGGNAYVHWKLAKFFEAEGDKDKVDLHRQSAVTAIEVALSLAPSTFDKGEDISFYIGSAGISALATVIFWMAGQLSKTEEHLHKLLIHLPSCLSEAAPDEILYGRAGYIFCLLFVKKYISKEVCERLGLEAAARQVFDALMVSGKNNSGVKHPEIGSLKYFFHEIDYLGAAHGTSGILYMLLQFPKWCQEPSNKPWIMATLDSILNTQFPSGNFPNKTGSTTDRLVHWCHGSPGVVYTLYHAHEVLGEDKVILRSLDQALKNIWERGLLRKGHGLCHGMAGNGYTFLMMYRYTGAEEHLYRAHKMAEAIRSEDLKMAVETYRDPQRYVVGVPDFPYSLMEGLGGTLCFCCDLLYPDSAAFPGYEGDVHD